MLIFRHLEEKRTLLGKFEKILKIFDENSIGKLNFYFIFICNFIFILFFENLLVKLEPSETTPVFCNYFFGFGGGGISPFPPAYALASDQSTTWPTYNFGSAKRLNIR